MTAMRLGSAPPLRLQPINRSRKILHGVFAFLNIVEVRVGLPITCGAANIGNQDRVTPRQEILIDWR